MFNEQIHEKIKGERRTKKDSRAPKQKRSARLVPIGTRSRERVRYMSEAA